VGSLRETEERLREREEEGGREGKMKMKTKMERTEKHGIAGRQKEVRAYSGSQPEDERCVCLSSPGNGYGISWRRRRRKGRRERRREGTEIVSSR